MINQWFFATSETH